MTIADLSAKIADKNRHISEIDENIKAVEAEIARLDRQKQSNVQLGNSEAAIELMKSKRAKQDELEVLCQVRDSIKSTPAVSHSDIAEVWGVISTDIRAEFDNEALPELEAAYSRYCQAVEAVIALRHKAHTQASQLDKIVGGSTAIDTPFTNVSLSKYYPNKSYLAKLNSMDSGGIVVTPITKPLSFDCFR